MTEPQPVRFNKISAVILLALLIGALAGYAARLLQDHKKPSVAMAVDPIWVSKARHCWKGLSTWTDDDIRTRLSSPPIFRSTFTQYSEDTDLELVAIAAKVPSGPASDTATAQPSVDSAPDFIPATGAIRGKRAPQYSDIPPGATIVSVPDGSKPWEDYAKAQPQASSACTLAEGTPFGFSQK